MNSIKGAIFDMDGTLLESVHMWLNLGSDYLKKMGLIPPEDINDILLTLTMKEAADFFINILGLKKTQEQIIREVNSHIEDFYRNEVIAKEGVSAFLKRLAAQNVKMCIATATDRYLVEAALTRCGIREYFSEIFTCSEIGKGKHEPDIYFAALRHLGTDIGETAVFEDAFYAAETAVNAGFRVVGVFDENSESDWQALSEIAEECVYSLGDLEF